MDDIQELQKSFEKHIIQESLENKARHEETSEKIACLEKQLDAVLTVQDATNKKLDPIVNMFDTVPIIKQIVVGIASFIIALTAIGASVIWFIKQVK